MIRWLIGGCEASTSASNPSRAENMPGFGSTMQRCAAPRVIARVGRCAAVELLQRGGERQRIAGELRPVASARNSRFRLTAIASIRETTGATTRVSSQSTSTTSASGLPPPFPLPPPPRRPPPPRAATPHHPAHPVRHQRDRPDHPGEQRHQPDVEVPHVRHLVGHDALQLVAAERLRAVPRSPRCWPWPASRPVANALGSSSGTTHTLGLGSPEAIAISSTTFTSCRCSGVAGLDDLPGAGGPEHPLRPVAARSTSRCRRRRGW